MRRKAIAELTKECSDMQKAGDPGGQERFVHIQLALEQNYSTNDKQPKIYGIFDLFMIVRERLDGALHSDECIGKGGLWVAACPHSDRPGCKSRVGHQFSIWIHSEGLISTGDLDQFNAIWSSFIGFFSLHKDQTNLQRSWHANAPTVLGLDPKANATVVHCQRHWQAQGRWSWNGWWKWVVICYAMFVSKVLSNWWKTMLW